MNEDTQIVIMKALDVKHTRTINTLRKVIVPILFSIPIFSHSNIKYASQKSRSKLALAAI